MEVDMRQGFLGIVLLVVQSFAFSLQQPPAAILEKDTDISVQLLHPLDAKNAKVGDKIEAKLQRDLTGRNNVLIAHEMSKVVGHVIVVQPHTEEQSHSRIIIAFDAIIADDGRQIPVMAVITGITPPSSKQVYTARIGSFPTSGDDPTYRSPGPIVDTNSGRIIAPTHPPTTDTGIAMPRVMSAPDLGPIEVATNALGQTRLTSPNKKDVKIKSGMILTLRVNNPRPTQ
jgi:hypothetical protein